MATVLKARTGPVKDVSKEETTEETTDSTAEARPSGKDIAAQIKQKAAPTKTKTKAAKAKTTKAKPNTASSNSKAIAKLAIAAISKVSESKYKDKQTPIGFNKSPLPVVSSGSLALDNLIGGNPATDGSGPICPGYPRRHISEIYGAEGSGKTTLALEAITQVQSEGGIAMFLDFEHALHHGYAKKIGVSFDEDKLLLYQPSSLEQGFDMMNLGIKLGVDIIVVDSVAAMVSAAEMEKGFSEADRVGERARKLASALPKIARILHAPAKYGNQGTALVFINQTRANIGGGPGSSASTSGGYALKFFAYLRLMATRIGSEYVEQVDPLTKKKVRKPYGNKTQVKVIKSKVDAKQGHTAEIFIRFGQGIDDYYSIISTGLSYGIIKKGGSYYDYGDHHIQGREKFRSLLMDNPKLFEEVREKILKAIRSQASDAIIEDENEDELEDLITSVSDEDLEAGINSEAEEVVHSEDDL